MEKNPNDVVITFAKRTAVGRAKKGQLKDTSVGEIMYSLFKVCLLPIEPAIFQFSFYVSFHRPLLKESS